MVSEKTEKTTHEKDSNGEYREQLYKEPMEILNDPSIDQLIIVAAKYERLTEKDIEELTSPTLDEEAYLRKRASLVEKAMNWRTSANGQILERHQVPITEEDIPEELREQIQSTAERLRMYEAVPMPGTEPETEPETESEIEPDVVGIFGATVDPVQERTNFAFDGMKGHPRVFGLGAERKMAAPDLRNQEKYTYVTKYRDGRGELATVETNLMTEAQAAWLQKNGYTDFKVSRYMRDPFSHEDVRDVDDESRIVREKTKSSPYGFQFIEFTGPKKPEWAGDIIVSLSPTYDMTTRSRSGTAEQIHDMIQLIQSDPTLPKDANITFVSHGIYRLAQDLEAKRVCAEMGNYRVTTAGYKQTTPANAILVGGEIGKVAQNARLLIDSLANKESAST